MPLFCEVSLRETRSTSVIALTLRVALIDTEYVANRVVQSWSCQEKPRFLLQAGEDWKC